MTNAGALLRAIAETLGARVTSADRDENENRAVGGSSTSAHLTGNAIDLGLDAPPAALAVLRSIAHVARHDKGTGPHWHVEVRPWTMPVVLAALLAFVALGAGHANSD